MKEVFVWGFNHYLLGIHERSSVSIDDLTQQRLYTQAKTHQISSFCILNTCNRTEIYGIGDVEVVQEIFFNTHPDALPLKPKVKFLTGESAIEHLLKVASGLDSQILGESEILGQFKAAFKTAKTHNLLNGYMERLSNISVQAAKEIKHSTGLSSGIMSFSYATINLLLESKIPKHARILMIGTGSLGKNIAKNIPTYFPGNPLYLTNRTIQKSQQLADELNCQVLDFDHLSTEIGTFDVIISTIGNVKTGLIHNSSFPKDDLKIIIDLSIPSVIDPEVANRKSVIFYSLDHVSNVINQAFAQRQQEVPFAEQIIHRYIHEFKAWDNLAQKSGSILQWKKMMEVSSSQCPHLASLDEKQRHISLQKSISQFVLYIKSNTDDFDHDDKEVIQNYLATLGREPAGSICFEDCPIESKPCPACPR